MSTTRVLLAGHTGTEKKTVALKLKEYLPKICQDWKNRIKVVHLEKCIGESGGGDTRLFAGVRTSRSQRDRWLQGWSEAEKKFKAFGARCEILSMHLSFAERNKIFCPADFATIAKWKPDIIFTLIDDVYSEKRRIQLNHYTFSLAQLYDWRTTEQMLADQVGILVGTLPGSPDKTRSSAMCESLLLAVKTPLLTTARLIAKGDCRRCYASYPISSTRGNNERKGEINRFRTRIHNTMPTFDPITIEERPLLDYYTLSKKQIRYDPCSGPPGHEQEENYKRWDSRLSKEGELAPMVWEPDKAKGASGKEKPFFPVLINRNEIKEMLLPEQGENYTTIDDQIEFRDIRLVTQSDLVVCYRPYMDGRITGGVNTEMEYASMMGKEVVAFVGKDKLQGKPLRAHISKSFEEEGEFWGYLEEVAKKPVGIPRPAYY